MIKKCRLYLTRALWMSPPGFRCFNCYVHGYWLHNYIQYCSLAIKEHTFWLRSWRRCFLPFCLWPLRWKRKRHADADVKLSMLRIQMTKFCSPVRQRCLMSTISDAAMRTTFMLKKWHLPDVKSICICVCESYTAASLLHCGRKFSFTASFTLKWQQAHFTHRNSKQHTRFGSTFVSVRLLSAFFTVEILCLLRANTRMTYCQKQSRKTSGKSSTYQRPIRSDSLPLRKHCFLFMEHDRTTKSGQYVSQRKYWPQLKTPSEKSACNLDSAIPVVYWDPASQHEIPCIIPICSKKHFGWKKILVLMGGHFVLSCADAFDGGIRSSETLSKPRIWSKALCPFTHVGRTRSGKIRACVKTCVIFSFFNLHMHNFPWTSVHWSCFVLGHRRHPAVPKKLRDKIRGKGQVCSSNLEWEDSLSLHTSPRQKAKSIGSKWTSLELNELEIWPQRPMYFAATIAIPPSKQGVALSMGGGASWGMALSIGSWHFP